MEKKPMKGYGPTVPAELQWLILDDGLRRGAWHGAEFGFGVQGVRV